MSSSTASGIKFRVNGPRAAVVNSKRVRQMRIALLLMVAVAFAINFVRPLVTWVETGNQLTAQQQQIRELEHVKQQLLKEKQALSSARGVTIKARKLGMVRKGEHTYVVSNLPDN